MTPWAMTRRRTSQWLPVLGFAAFACLSLVVLELDYRRGVSALEETVVAVDNLTRAKLAVADAALAWEAIQGGNPTSAPGVQLLRLDEAVGALEDLLAGHSTLISFPGGQVLDGSDQRGLVRAYRDRVSDVRAALRAEGAAGDPVAQRLRLRGLSEAATDLERAVYRAVGDRLVEKRRRHVLLLGAWSAFLALSLIGLVGIRAAGKRARVAGRRAERGRRAAERRYTALERVAAVGVLRVDGTGVVREVTPWWGRAMGRNTGDCLGTPWWTVSTEEGREAVAGAWREGVATGVAFSQDVRLTNAEGKRRWLAGRWQPDAAPSAQGAWVGAFLDVTEQRLLETQVHQAQKLEAVGRLTGGLSHDFNNLLSVILTNTHLLLMDTGTLGEEDREILGDIDRAAKSGRDLVKRLMTFSRRGDLNLAPMDLSAAVEAAAALAKRLLPPGHELEVSTPKTGPSVHADVRAIEQIILNLVSNARDAMERGGCIRITVDDIEADAEFRGERPWVEPGRYGRVTVSDEGAGMDAATLEQIFEPLFTTKSEGKGTGLGLSTVHGLMRQHQGHVRVYSETGVGTTFRLYFPETLPVVDRVPGGREGREAVLDGSAAGSALTVLLVDDDEDLRRTSRRMLVRLGYRVIEARDGVEALRVLDGPVAPDLILSDLAMAGMGGLELFHRIEERGDRRPFVFTSGRLQAELEGRAVLPEGARFLPKPWGAEQFTKLVEELGLRAG